MSRSERERVKVLCVDDEPALLSALRLTLSRRYDVHTAESGVAGLEILSEEGPFAVVISDMMMPGMKGTEFLSAAKDRAPGSTRVLLTGMSSMQDAIDAVNEGGIYRFLTKPCPAERLRAVVADCVDYHRMYTADQALIREEVEALRGQLLHAERLSTLGTLAGALGHELGNVSQVFSGALEFIRMSLAAGEAIETEDLDSLEWSLEHLRNHAKSLLRLARPAEVEDEAVDVRDIVRRVVSLLRVTKGEDVDLEVDAPEPAFVFANAARLEQVFLNLAKNGVEAHEGGVGDRRPFVRVGVHRDGDDRVLCRVEDRGAGISEEDLQKIFEPYFTTKPVGKGTGLGLPIVRQIVQRLGGKIDASSQPGVGTVMEIVLPALPAGSVQATPELAASGSAA